MPPLSAEEYAALREDIAVHGILVPVLVDQHGNVLDGHHRQAIAAELGINCPTETRVVADDEAAYEIAFTLNLARRHLTREQKRVLIAAEIERRPDDSDRAIGRRLGCDHKTVGSVRRGETPHPEPMTREEAEASTERIRAGLHEWDRAIVVGLLRGAPPALMARGTLESFTRFERENGDREIVDAIRRHIAMPRVEAILAWPHGGFYADAIASVDDELRGLLDAQRGLARGGRDG
jgi:ParB family chromosome partitioning protein